MRITIAAALAATFLLAACSEKEPVPEQQVAEADPAAKLQSLFEDYFERNLQLNPLNATFIGDDRYNDRYANSIGPEHRAATLAMNEEFLARLDAIDRDVLSRQDQLSYDMFRLERELAIEGHQYPGHLQPINQFWSPMNLFAMLGSGKSVQPFKTVKDYDDWLSRIDGFVVYADQAIDNMQEGIRTGIVQPTILMEKSLPQIQAHVVESAEESGFWMPITDMPETFGSEDRERLTAEFRNAIETKVVPAYQRVANFIGDEYLAATRDTVGLYALPDGRDWYEYNVRVITSTDLTPDEIHQIGLDEVARIHDEMRGVMEEVGFEGNLDEFFEFMDTDPQFYFDEPEQLIQGYRDMSSNIIDLSKKLFAVFPRSDFEVRRVEPFREASASAASYVTGTPDGSRPGVFYANAYDLSARPKWGMESLFLHEAIPGHHFQRSLQVENEKLPGFRRFGGQTAYTEGWGLYAESLGKELGVYTDPYQYFGALNAELWRSIRLVTDTGIHWKGWTRQEVLDYMYANSAVNESRAVSEAERFMAIPGQALAYKIGQLKIREIREKAEAALGDRFDIKEFHTQVLMDGPMPLSMLEAKIDDWIEKQI